MKKKVLIIFICLFSISCSNRDGELNVETLESYVANRLIEEGGVIACAASNELTQDVSVFFFPEQSATDVRFYETVDTQNDANNYFNYKRVFLDEEPFFNGYLGKFITQANAEKWVIITYVLNDMIKLSNPIRLKHISKPTVYSDNVEITQESQAQSFIWEDNAYGDNAIYFQVVSDASNNLLSGTYTYENKFTYYDTNNVVLNITQETPPILNSGSTYNFTLMDVSEDNWVNLVVQKTFIAL